MRRPLDRHLVITEATARFVRENVTDTEISKPLVIGSDLEWSRSGIDVLGLAWDGGKVATATNKDVVSMTQYLSVLHKADIIVGQNFLSADIPSLAKEGIDVSLLTPKVRDIRLLFHALHAHLAGSGSFDLRSIVLLVGAKQGYRFPLDFKQYATDIHKTCAMDSAAALFAYTILERQVTNAGLQATVDISHRCAPVFELMHQRGVRLDTAVLVQIHEARKSKTIEIVEKYHLWEERGVKKIKRVPIWRSNKILDIFQQQFGIRPKDRKRVTWVKLAGDPKLSPEAKEFAEAIIDLGKGANDATFVGKAEESEDGLNFSKLDADGFIHPRYDICGSPDRAIASGPNIQQWTRPADDPRPVPLRSAVIPLRSDHVILEADFSAIENVTNAYESHDMDRVRAVLDKRVSHAGTAQLVNEAFGLSLDRQQGKAINHGLEKGESPYNLARTLFKTTRPSKQQIEQCQTIYTKLLQDYPQLSKFRDELWERAKANPLVVTNSFGRRLMCFSRSKYGDAGERWAKHNSASKYWCPCGECSPRRDRFKYAVAFLGRSCAFDILLRAMARIWYDKLLDDYSLPYIEVHDSLAFSVPRDKAEFYADKLRGCFNEPVPELGGVSLQCEVKIGDNWAQCK